MSVNQQRHDVAQKRVRSLETGVLLLRIVEQYHLEEILAPDLLEEITEETIDELFKMMTAEEILKRVCPADRLKGMSADELLAAVSPETRAALAQRLKDDLPPNACSD